MTQQETMGVLAFVGQSDHGWTHQPTARVVNAGIATNPPAECVEITLMEGNDLSDITGNYKPVVEHVYSMAGARLALGY